MPTIRVTALVMIRQHGGDFNTIKYCISEASEQIKKKTLIK